MTRFAIAGVVAVAVTSAGVAAGQADPSRSAGPAQALIRLLDAQGLQAIAAPDPGQPGRFVAALYVPGAELLVVSATYPAPAALASRLKQKEYREAYIDLQATASTKDRIFVEDMQANGLRPACAEGEPFDIVSIGGTDTRFDSNWAGQKLTEAEYQSRFASGDARYAEMLSALIARLRPTT